MVDAGLKFAENEYARLLRETEDCKSRIAKNKKLLTHYNGLIAAYGDPAVASANGLEPESEEFPCKRKGCEDRKPFNSQGYLDRHMRQIHGVGA